MIKKELFSGEKRLEELKDILDNGSFLNPEERKQYGVLKEREKLYNAGNVRGQKKLFQ